jgi:long-chain-acyl-CoA dehydrogenase
VDRAIFDREHLDFRDTVREFVRRHVAPAQDKLIEQRVISRDIWLEAGRQGFLGLEVPEIYGGSNAEDWRFNAVLGEELAASSAALNSSFGIHYDVVAPYLVQLSTPAQRELWLPRFCAGTLLTAIAMTEPSAGSDLAGIRTSAVKTDSGWVINGSKTFITNGFHADLVIVAAKTSPERRARGISLFAVESGTSGFTRGRKLDKVGQPEADTAELFFEDVEVSDMHLIGELDGGFTHMMSMLPQERISAAVSNLAHARSILFETIAYCRERTAFGTPIGSFQHNKFRIAELVTTLDVAQAFIDNCILEHYRKRLSAVDAAKAKWWSSDVQGQILDACVQLYGGYGYMKEYRVARAWADARVTRIWAGSNEIMKEIIGRDLGF